MKINYYPETDSLYIDLNSMPSVESREISDGLVLDFDTQGRLAGIDVDHASKFLDLTTLEIDSLPVKITSAPTPRQNARRHR